MASSRVEGGCFSIESTEKEEIEAARLLKKAHVRSLTIHLFFSFFDFRFSSLVVTNVGNDARFSVLYGTAESGPLPLLL